jgi:DNA polymerase elongation subunit (family B)
MNKISTADNPVLYGADPTANVVAAELAGRFIRLFIRTDHGVVFHDVPFHPFVLVASPQLLDSCPVPFSCRPLAGEEGYRFLVTFATWHDCLAARDHLVKQCHRTASDPAAPYLFLSDPVHQHLLLSGTTFFKGLEFDQLKRLAIDIETDCSPGFEFSNPDRDDDRILTIAVMGKPGVAEVLGGPDHSEQELLEQLNSIIQNFDPDVIEGHNIFRFDLEYIRIRAKRHGVRLTWGRDHSEPRVHHSRLTIAERVIDFPRWDIFGRSIVDTYFLLQLYDVSNRELESYGLKAAARHFGLTEPDRVYVDGRDISRLAREDLEKLRQYNLDDTRETLALSRLLSYSHFLQARIFPYTYQTGMIRGNATRINALFLREYLRQGVAIPHGGGRAELSGGQTDIFRTGVVGPVLSCDVASLYPSLLLAYQLRPARDSLNLFLPLLSQLREFRLQAKQLARSVTDPGEREYYEALQQAFKVLINSFYGYLGAPLHNFSDLAMAAEVTRLGRETIREMLAWLESHGAQPIEMDTDGIYFIPPPQVQSHADQQQLVATMSATLPAGINVELAGRYRAMFSYKIKNYALLGDDGTVTIKGSSLKSRGIEKYLRLFMAELIRLLLTGAGERVEELLHQYQDRLMHHDIPIEQLARTETLGESPASYRDKVRAGKRNPSAAYEIALAADQNYRAGDQISYYVTGRSKNVTAYLECRPIAAHDPLHPDENIPYYLEKLHHLFRKFKAFLPPERTLFD